MGQRHQIFLKVVNPFKVLNGDGKDRELTAQLKKTFGVKATTILAFHNQWLYGRSALQSALNILIHVSQFTQQNKVSKTTYDGSNTPFCQRGIDWKFGKLETYIATVSFILNYVQTNKDFINAGLLGSWFLNTDEPEMRSDFTQGDNNDGITIIDTIRNRYCFMNIDSYPNTEGELSHSASDLPYLKPVSAADYVRAYYGETPETVNTNDKPVGEVIAENIEMNTTLIEEFKPFKLLTLKEISSMFPKMTLGEEIKVPA